jgi:hypothetical protein
MSTAVKLSLEDGCENYIYPSLTGEESWTGFDDTHVRPKPCRGKGSAQMDVTSGNPQTSSNISNSGTEPNTTGLQMIFYLQ